MKKVLILIMAFLAVGPAAPCGENCRKDTKAGTLKSVTDRFGLDPKSAEEQKMSSERATYDQLDALKHGFFKDIMIFDGTEFADLTYDDIKAQLGVDASYYYLEDALVEKQCFVWQAEGNDAVKLLISFTKGKIYGLGSANIG